MHTFNLYNILKLHFKKKKKKNQAGGVDQGHTEPVKSQFYPKVAVWL